MRRSKSTTARVAERRRQKPVPELPAWKAFVVQFSREASGRAEALSGRVEHLSSGRRARFESGAELLAVLCKLLDELNGNLVEE